MWDSNSINYQGKLCNHVKLYYKHICCLINISIPQLKFLGFFSQHYTFLSVYMFLYQFFLFLSYVFKQTTKQLITGEGFPTTSCLCLLLLSAKNTFLFPSVCHTSSSKKAWITYAYLFQNVPIDVVQGTLTPPKRFGVHWFSSNEMC